MHSPTTHWSSIFFKYSGQLLMGSLYGPSSLSSLDNLMSNEVVALDPCTCPAFPVNSVLRLSLLPFQVIFRDIVNHLPPVSSLISEHGYLESPFQEDPFKLPQ